MKTENTQALGTHRANIYQFINICLYYLQGDYSPDNVKFPDNSMTFP